MLDRIPPLEPVDAAPSQLQASVGPAAILGRMEVVSNPTPKGSRTMRSIAGAIVVLAGSLLWGAGALAESWIYMAQHGNRGTAQVATYGGMAVVAIGCLVLFLSQANRKPGE